MLDTTYRNSASHIFTPHGSLKLYTNADQANVFLCYYNNISIHLLKMSKSLPHQVFAIWNEEDMKRL